MRGAVIKFFLLAIISVFELGTLSPSAAQAVICNNPNDTTNWDKETKEVNPGTTRAEKCAWARIRDGQAAVFAKPQPGNTDESTPPESSESRELRKLRGDFMKEILLGKWSSQIPLERIRIQGAIIEKMWLENLAMDKILVCQNCDFEGGVRFVYVRSKWFIDLTGSRIIGPGGQGCKADDSDRTGILNLGGLSIDGSVLLNELTADCAIMLDGAKIKENLILQDSSAPRLEGKYAHIEGRVTIQRSYLANLDFAKASIGWVEISDINGLYENETNGAAITLNGASIDHDLELVGGLIKGFSASNMTVGGTLVMRNPRPGVDARALTCEGACVIKLRNSNVGSFELLDSLGAQFDVVGLVYKNFTLLQGDGNTFPQSSDEEERYQKWLYCPSEKPNPPSFFIRLARFFNIVRISCSSRRPGQHSPQPYLQLAQVFKIAGYNDEADKIHIWEREANREQTKSWIGWSWEWLKYIVIGYGYTKSRAFAWAVFFLLVGWFVVRKSQIARKHGFGFTYSFDMLLPIVRLREKHYTTELELPYRAYFYVHRIIGYLLGLFILAALSGLTSVT
jgi:hypothetical protein